MEDAFLINIKEFLRPVFDKYANKLVFAYLFGSSVKGDATPLSDIDIAVYLRDVESDAVFDIKLSMHRDISRALRRNDVDLLVLNTVSNNMLIEDILRHCIVIYDRDNDAREDYEVRILHQAIDFKTQRLLVMGI